MRKKKVIYRKNTPAVLFMLFIIAASGVCLTLAAKNGGIDFDSGAVKYIAGAVSGLQEPEKEEISAREAEIITGSCVTGTEGDAGLTAIFIGSAVAGVNADKNSSPAEEKPAVVSSNVKEPSSDGQEQAEAVVSDVTGSVLVYHTHSTESYEPYSEGNYHITGDKGTVRNVAESLAGGLASKGITVYHDKTLHDNPTYTNSYGRSLNTAKSYLNQYGDIKVVIDLHRDAMAASGKKYSTVEVNGARAVSFNVVVGRQNSNYSQLMNFAGQVISKANELYPGLGGRIIEREYKFNQYLSDHYLLLEVGNNGNSIEEAELTGKLLADVIEAVMREI